MSSRLINRRHRTGDSGRSMSARIARGITEALPTLITQLQNLNTNTTSATLNLNANNYKRFTTAKPPTYVGTEGATTLLQWFERMESVFLHCECPEEKNTTYASSVFDLGALTWWNSEKYLRGAEVAMALPWEDLKKLMLKQFCPKHEVQKLETEFWELKQIGGDNAAYNNRFHELKLLVPHMATPLERAIDKYISGLPLQIQDTVLGRDPKTLHDAITLAGTLTKNHIKAGTLTRNNTKKPMEKATTEPTNEAKIEASSKTVTTNNNHNNYNNKRKHQNYALTDPNSTPDHDTRGKPKKPYTGTHPLCNTCKLHHPKTAQCRVCSNCGRFGHLINTCRVPMKNQYNASNSQPAMQPVHPPYVPPHVRACYHCGNPNHLRNACPQLYNIQTKPINPFQAYHAQTFPIQPQLVQSQPMSTQLVQAQTILTQLVQAQPLYVQPIQTLPPQGNPPTQTQENQVYMNPQGRVNYTNTNEFQFGSHGTTPH